MVFSQKDRDQPSLQEADQQWHSLIFLWASCVSTLLLYTFLCWSSQLVLPYESFPTFPKSPSVAWFCKAPLASCLPLPVLMIQLSSSAGYTLLPQELLQSSFIYPLPFEVFHSVKGKRYWVHPWGTHAVAETLRNGMAGKSVSSKGQQKSITQTSPPPALPIASPGEREG